MIEIFMTRDKALNQPNDSARHGFEPLLRLYFVKEKSFIVISVRGSP